MKKRADMARDLREKGLSYKDIADILGVSKQAVYQAVNPKSKSKNGIHKTTIEKVRYTGLRQWMLENYAQYY